jgi:hypothetical protein
MGLSIRAYARHRGVSHVAVKKAIDAGRITAEADGKIDPDKADRQWAHNTLQPKAPVTKPVSASSLTVGPGASGESGAPATGMTLVHAKTANEVLKAQLGKVRLSQMKGELVDRSQAITHVFALARAERDALLNWPAQIAADLAAELLATGITPHSVLLALEGRLRDYLTTLGELRPKVD